MPLAPGRPRGLIRARPWVAVETSNPKAKAGAGAGAGSLGMTRDGATKGTTSDTNSASHTLRHARLPIITIVVAGRVTGPGSQPCGFDPRPRAPHHSDRPRGLPRFRRATIASLKLCGPS